MNIPLKKLSTMKVLNIGTGIETVVFRKLGAKKFIILIFQKKL